MRNSRKTIEKSMECTVCYNVVKIQRLSGRNKLNGHIKTMYCPHCKDVRQFIELCEYFEFVVREKIVIESGYARYRTDNLEKDYYGILINEDVYFERVKDQSNLYYKLQRFNKSIPIFCSEVVFKNKFKKI